MTSDCQTQDSARGLGLVFRALQYRNYRLYFTGHGISLIGTWLQFVALPWLVYNLHPTPMILGIVGFAGQIPGFVLSPIGGVLADRFDRRRILLVTQSLAMAQAFALATLVITNIINIWHILALSAFAGVVNAIDMPTRQSFVADLAEDKDSLANVIALNSSMFNSARLIGPTVGGILIAAVGTSVCFLINALSYVAVLASLAAMRIPRKPIEHHSVSVTTRLKEGCRYAMDFSPIRYTLLLLTLVSLVGTPYAMLMPAFAKTILHGGPKTLGFLMAASGAGALTGAIFLASRKSIVGLGKWIPLATALFGASLIAFAFSRVMWLSALLLVPVGFGLIVQMAASNTIIQTIVDEDKRGRVMSLYVMSFLGAAPIGNLLAGALASKIGPPKTVAIGGLLSVLGAAAFATVLPSIRKAAHPVFIKLGIMPEAAGATVAEETMT